MGSKVAAGFIIFRRFAAELEYLLLQTSYGEHHWTPPKGHVDPGESEFQTAIRETQEEAGLTEDQLYVHKDFQQVLNYQVRGKPKRVVYWVAELKDPKTNIVLSDEHIDYKWLCLGEALKYAKYQDMQNSLQEVDTYLKKIDVKL